MKKSPHFCSQWQILLSLPLAFLLGGCGGGGSSSLPTNTTPVIDSLSVNGTVVSASSATPIVTIPTNSTSVLVCTAHDPTLSPLTFTWMGLTDTPTSTSGNSTITTTPSTDGNVVVTCTVSNVRGKSISRTVTLNAQTTSSATLSLVASAVTVAPGKTIQITAVGSGSGTLAYQFSVIQGSGTVTQNAATPSQATFTAPTQTGSNIVLCTLTDALGNSRTATVTIAVQ